MKMTRAEKFIKEIESIQRQLNALEKEHRVYTSYPELAEAGGRLLDVGVESVVDVIFGAKIDDKTVKKHKSNLPENVQARKAEYERRTLSYNLQIRTL